MNQKELIKAKYYKKNHIAALKKIKNKSFKERERHILSLKMESGTGGNKGGASSGGQNQGLRYWGFLG